MWVLNMYMEFSAIEMKPHCTNYGIALKSMQINLQTNFRIVLQSDNHIYGIKEVPILFMSGVHVQFWHFL